MNIRNMGGKFGSATEFLMNSIFKKSSEGCADAASGISLGEDTIENSTTPSETSSDITLEVRQHPDYAQLKELIIRNHTVGQSLSINLNKQNIDNLKIFLL